MIKESFVVQERNGLVIDHLDLQAGQRLQIRLGGQWIAGCVEENFDGVVNHYFISDDGGICGMCAGMMVRYEGGAQ